VETTPHDLIGGRDVVLALANRFYDAMERDEPELMALHDCKAPGKVTDTTRERFGLFLVGWLGGEQEYMAKHGHPRLRMRHHKVPIDIAMRDAWLRAMSTALDETGIGGDLRAFLDERFAHVANFLRNVPEDG
jgi:hemoglobin